jgi:hypothetical protein
VFKVNVDGSNNIERYKCRIVARGFSQVAGLDFDETFAPVVRIESVHCLLAYTVFFGLHLLHIDCKIAKFLNGESDVELYIVQPEGFVDQRYPHKILHLNKSLYGLKQAPRIWYLLLCSVIISFDFVALESDPGIYTNRHTGVIVAVYIDDFWLLHLSNNSVNNSTTTWRTISESKTKENLRHFLASI